ncbi:helix-turn-helix transcriptional regulator [Gemmatimonas groenlandica]|uniref:Helix-turn-helix transcriptional regulator n=2 Tax=Gemmatimonas groenlandica TaxID=2732249 RepID=A0A6M4IT11_9BACT|nr:helix-turn-helix transcriptional regulator [Gemmatimonas groenlandica]
MSSTPVRVSRASPRRNAELTRLAIRRAARQLWAERPYDMVGVREIAARAGVTASLVNRYFGTKAELFRQSLESDPDPADLDRRRGEDPKGTGARVSARLHGPLGEVVANIASADPAVSAESERSPFDPTLLLLRSTPSLAARTMVSDRVAGLLLKPLISSIRAQGRSHPEARAAALLSIALGISGLSEIFGQLVPEGEDNEPFRSLLVCIVDAITRWAPVV